MAESCTIYGNLAKRPDIVSAMAKHFDDLSVDGNPEEWSSITGRTAAGSVTLNALVFQHQGDEFSNLHFQTCMFLWDLETLDDDAKEQLNEAFGSQDLIIGVVVEPGFASDQVFNAAISEIARVADGLILTGTSILDSSGRTLARFS